MLKKSMEQDRTYLFRHMKVFPVYIQDYFKSKLHSLSPSTLRGYAIDFEDFLEWMIEDGIANVDDIKDITLPSLEEIKISQIKKGFVTYLNLREYKAGRKKKGQALNPKTLNRKLAALRALFYWLTNVAKDENGLPLLQKNVMETIEIEQPIYDPVTAATRIRNTILIGKEIDEYRNFVIKGYGELPNLKKLSKRRYKENKERDLAIISLIIENGIRIEEIANLSLDDVDMIRYRLKVSRKAGKSIVLDLNERAARDLEVYLNLRSEQYNPSKEQKALFLTNQQAPGQAMTKRAIQNMIEKYSSAFGKPLLTAHKLRHSFGANHYATYKDIEKLQEIMGHSDVQTTEVYEYVLNNHFGEVLK